MKIRPSLLVAAAFACAACEPGLPKEPSAPATVAALYDPGVSPPQLPSPNDLTLAAQMLTGFSPTSTLRVRFTNKILLTGHPFLLVDLNTGAAVSPATYTLSLDGDGKGITVVPATPFALSHRYAAAVFGGISDTGSLVGAEGETAVPAPTFFFLRSPVPVLGLCTRPEEPACACPDDVVAAGDPDDEACRAVVSGLSDADARRLELGRRGIDQLIKILGLDGRRQEIVVLWTFTIAGTP